MGLEAAKAFKKPNIIRWPAFSKHAGFTWCWVPSQSDKVRPKDWIEYIPDPNA